MSRCASTESIRVSAKFDVACTTTAAPTASKSRLRSASFPAVMTSSMRILDAPGKTSPASRLMTIRTKPRTRIHRRGQRRSRATYRRLAREMRDVGADMPGSLAARGPLDLLLESRPAAGRRRARH